MARYKKTEQVDSRIPIEMKSTLRDFAKEQDLSLSKLIAKYIRQGINRDLSDKKQADYLKRQALSKEKSFRKTLDEVWDSI